MYWVTGELTKQTKAIMLCNAGVGPGLPDTYLVGHTLDLCCG